MGFMYEEFSHTYYSELFTAFDLYFHDELFMTNAEFRIAKDYDTGATPRTEGSLRFNLRFFDTESIVGYITLGGTYQNYYSSVDIWAIHSGLCFNIR